MNISHTNIDFNSRMICVIENDVIYEVNTSGQTQAIGHTNKWCDELVEVANEYKQLCLDNGLIEEEKTPEQIQIEMMTQMAKMMEVIQTQSTNINQLSNELEVLKNGSNATSITRSNATGDRQSKGKSSGNTSNEKSTGSANEE